MNPSMLFLVVLAGILGLIASGYKRFPLPSVITQIGAGILFGVTTSGVINLIFGTKLSPLINYTDPGCRFSPTSASSC